MRNDEVDEEGWYVREGDEEINDQLEAMVAAVDVTSSIPTSLKATLQFGYEDSMKIKLGAKDFDSYIQTVMTHVQSHYRHSESLGTEIIFDVR